MKMIAGRHNRGTAGFTLLETMVALSMLSIIMLVLYTLMMAMTRTVQVQEAKIIMQEEARASLAQITRDVRQASSGTIVLLNNNDLTFQMAADTDGNGLSLNADLSLGLSPATSYRIDPNDNTQLIRQQTVGGITTTTVLSSNLAPGTGLDFQDLGQGRLLVSLNMERQSQTNGSLVRAALFEVVTPRN